MRLLGAACAALVPWAAVAAQGARPSARLDGSAVAALTAAGPVPAGGGMATELRIVHPVLMLRAGTAAGRLELVATVDFDGWTIPNGELAPGMWGEGFVDRRHPHTFAHELMLVAHVPAGGTRMTLAAGRGFVPFGTDDPMGRPPVRYPVNHHLSQILERAVAIVALDRGSLRVEGALFGGDEPQSPGQWPRLDRFGDSWAARLTVRPTLRPGAGLELQASHARVHSPEHREGSGLDQVKWSASARWTGRLGRAPGYALAEWARTSEDRGTFVYHTILVEGALESGRHRPYARIETTERPEEQRAGRYRTVRPLLDDAILGVTRWTIVTVGYGLDLAWGRLRLRPFAEGSLGRIANVRGGFDPAGYYGGTATGTATLGLRVATMPAEHRMGRYADHLEQHDHH